MTYLISLLPQVQAARAVKGTRKKLPSQAFPHPFSHITKLYPSLLTFFSIGGTCVSLKLWLASMVGGQEDEGYCYVGKVLGDIGEN